MIKIGFLVLFVCSFSGYCADSKKVAIVKAQMQVEAGEFTSAIKYLAKATAEHPNVDVLFALYGQALYEHKDISLAEVQFRQALKINPLNTVAKSYIELIRATQDATTSEKSKQFTDISFDKIGDLIAMALAFLVASIINRYLITLSAWRYSWKSKMLFLKGDFDDFTDLLEIQIANNSLKSLRHSLNFMLQHKSPEEVIEILELYVNTEDNFKILKRMIIQDAKRMANR
ncbi:MAG: hypothetical protein COB35_02550 [Gammaproteobacteria bacterium]|nr:MAG: hypothetical protein COB35_02550 [Gammaproteobacteria bacterium]